MNSIDMSPVRVVWIDLDDTIIDFHANSRAALANLYHQRSFDILWPTVDDWIAAYERHNISLWVDYSVGIIDNATLRLERFRRPLTEAGVADADARKLSPDLDPQYLDLLAQEKKLIPGAIELLDALRGRSLTIGVLSNGFADVQHRKIARAGLTDKIDITVLSDDIGVNKPDTRLFRYAQSRTPWPDNPSAHLMIGDNPATDIGGALKAGWQAVWFNPKRQPDCPEGAAEFASLADIMRAL